MMKDIAVREAESDFSLYRQWFINGKIPENVSYAKITEKGISSFGDALYLSGETLERYMNRLGLTAVKKYVINTYAYICGGEWNQKDTAGFNEELHDYIDSIDANDYIVSIDCHM